VQRLAFLILLFLCATRLFEWKKNRERAHFWISELTSGPSGKKLRGQISEQASGKWTLENPQIESEPFFGSVEFSSFTPPVHLDGEEVIVEGPFRRQKTYRNPGQVSDGFLTLRQPRLVADGRRVRRVVERQESFFSLALFRRSFSRQLKKLFAGYPGIHCLCRAVWFGDMRGFNSEMQRFYQHGGLLQILALSGQHVVILTLILFVFLRNILKLGMVRGIRWLDNLRFLHSAVPLFAASILYVTGNGAPPIKRTLVTLLCFQMLRLFRFDWSVLQVVCSSAACQIIWAPDCVSNPSFFLSSAATVLLCRIIEPGGKHSLKNYLFFCIVMPILFIPLSAFFFGKVALGAPLVNCAVAWLWDLFLIPLGLVLPPVYFIFPEWLTGPLCVGLERLWEWLVIGHQNVLPWVENTYVSTIRPDWVQFICGETILLWMILRVRYRRHSLPFFARRVEIIK
jgi:hypothetical protein